MKRIKTLATRNLKKSAAKGGCGECQTSCQSASKTTPLDSKWLPIICGVLGGVLGIVAMYIMPDYPAKDILTSIAVGIASGLAATGTNQIFKQLRSNSNK